MRPWHPQSTRPVPPAGEATTASVRSNFSTIATEIGDLQDGKFTGLALTAGGVLLAKSATELKSTAVMADGEFLVGDGTTDPVLESGGTVRASLGLAIGTDVQAYDAQLADIAALATTDNSFIVGDGSNFVLESAAVALASMGGVGAATAHTFTNKTFDANGTGNSLSNVDVADLANGTDGELITWDSAAAPATVAAGASGQVLTSNGAGSAPTFQAAGGGGFTLGTAQATTSGTSFNFGSIPAGTTMIFVHFDDVGTDGTENLLIQIGDAGGIETSGYLSNSEEVASTAGFIVRANGVNREQTGLMILTLENSSTFSWTEFHSTGVTATDIGTVGGGGTKSLSAELTQLTLLDTGADTFDSGAVNISYL